MPFWLILAWAAFDITPAELQVRLQEGTAALEHNDLPKAEAVFEELTKINADNAAAWLLLARAYAKDKKTQQAGEAAKKAELTRGSDPKILQHLAEFYATVAPDPGKAADFGTRYAAQAPEDTTAWRRLAAFCLQAGMSDRAIAAGTRGLSVDDSAELHTILGNAYLQQRDWTNAVIQMNSAVKRNQYSEDAHYQLARVYLRQPDFASAARVLEDARKIFDRSAQIELALGVAYYGQRKFAEAVDRFLKTMQLAPDVPQPYIFVSRIMDHANDRIPELMAQFTAFQERNPKSNLGYLLHAKAIVAKLPSSGFPAEAQAAFDLVQKSLSLKEDAADSHYLLGLLLERKGQYEASARELERSVQLNANDPAVHYRLARVYSRLGRKAESEQQRALHQKLSAEENNPVNLPAPGSLK